MMRWALIGVVLLLLAGCAGPAPTATPASPPPTDTVANLPGPTDSAAALVSPTGSAGLPPPAPTAAPDGATAAPNLGAGLTADAVLAAFRAAGLPIGEVTAFPAQPPTTPPPDTPGQYLTKVSWHDTRLPPPVHPILIEVSEGGAVEVYADPATAQTHADNIQGNAQIFSSQAETDVVHGPVLVRLAHDLPPDAVAAYKQVLDGLP